MTKRIERHYEKSGPKFIISYETAIDAFGRVKDGEKRAAISRELGVDKRTLRNAFIRVGLVGEKQ